MKIAERRATLLGLNPPIGHAVAVIQHEPPAKMTTTQEIGALIDSIMGIESKPESDAVNPALDSEGLTRIALDLGGSFLGREQFLAGPGPTPFEVKMPNS